MGSSSSEPIEKFELSLLLKGRKDYRRSIFRKKKKKKERERKGKKWSLNGETRERNFKESLNLKDIQTETFWRETCDRRRACLVPRHFALISLTVSIFQLRGNFKKVSNGLKNILMLYYQHPWRKISIIFCRTIKRSFKESKNQKINKLNILYRSIKNYWDLLKGCWWYKWGVKIF